LPSANKKPNSSITLFLASVTGNVEEMQEPTAKQLPDAEVTVSNAQALPGVDNDDSDSQATEQGSLETKGKLPITSKEANSSITLFLASVTGNGEEMKEPKAKQPSDAEVTASNAQALPGVDNDDSESQATVQGSLATKGKLPIANKTAARTYRRTQAEAKRLRLCFYGNITMSLLDFPKVHVLIMRKSVTLRKS